MYFKTASRNPLYEFGAEPPMLGHFSHVLFLHCLLNLFGFVYSQFLRSMLIISNFNYKQFQWKIFLYLLKSLKKRKWNITYIQIRVIRIFLDWKCVYIDASRPRVGEQCERSLSEILKMYRKGTKVTDRLRKCISEILKSK